MHIFICRNELQPIYGRLVIFSTMPPGIDWQQSDKRFFYCQLNEPKKKYDWRGWDCLSARCRCLQRYASQLDDNIHQVADCDMFHFYFKAIFLFRCRWFERLALILSSFVALNEMWWHFNQYFMANHHILQRSLELSRLVAFFSLPLTCSLTHFVLYNIH